MLVYVSCLGRESSGPGFVYLFARFGVAADSGIDPRIFAAVLCRSVVGSRENRF